MISRLIRRNIKLEDIAVIEIKNKEISCFLYEYNSQLQYKLKAISKVPAEGFDGCEIINLKKALSSMEILIDNIEQTTRRRVVNVIINAPYLQTKMISFPYLEEISNVVTKDTIKKALDYNNYQKILNNDNYIISLRANNFYLDNKLVENPLNLYAKKIKVDVSLVSVFKPHIINLYKLLEHLYLEVQGIIYLPNALPYFYDKNRKGNLIISIDKEQTIINYSLDYKTKYSKILNVGSNNVFKYVAKELKIAEEIFSEPFFNINNLRNFKGKIIKFNYNNEDYEIAYSKFYKILKLGIMEFFINITDMIEIENLTTDGGISIIGDACELIMISDLFEKQVKDNMMLNSQLRKESNGFKIDLGDVGTISLLKYYLLNLDKDSAMISSNYRLKLLNK